MTLNAAEAEHGHMIDIDFSCQYCHKTPTSTAPFQGCSGKPGKPPSSKASSCTRSCLAFGRSFTLSVVTAPFKSVHGFFGRRFIYSRFFEPAKHDLVPFSGS